MSPKNVIWRIFVGFIERIPIIFCKEISGDVSNRIPGEISKVSFKSIYKNISKCIPERLLDQISSWIPVEICERVLDSIRKNVWRNHRRKIPEEIKGGIWKEIFVGIPGKLLERSLVKLWNDFLIYSKEKSPTKLFYKIPGRFFEEILWMRFLKSPWEISWETSDNIPRNISWGVLKQFMRKLRRKIFERIHVKSSNNIEEFWSSLWKKSWRFFYLL